MIFGAVRDPTIAQLRDAHRLLEPAIERAGDSSWVEVLQLLAEDMAQLWFAMDGDRVRGACVTKMARRHAEPCVEIWLMGGDLETVPFIATIEAAAEEAGATRVSLTGRRGWDRVLNDRGYRVVAIELEKVL